MKKSSGISRILWVAFFVSVLVTGPPLAAQSLSIETEGEVKALGFEGDGSNITNVNAIQLGGVDAAGYALDAELQNAVSALSPRSIHISPGMIELGVSVTDGSQCNYGADPERVAIGGWAHPALEFGSDQVEAITFLLPVPVDWNQSSPIRFILLWSSPATTGEAAWGFHYKATGLDNSIVDATRGPTVPASPSTTANGLVATEIGFLTPGNTSGFLVTDRLLYIRVNRLVGCEDELADVAHIYGIEIVYNEP